MPIGAELIEPRTGAPDIALVGHVRRRPMVRRLRSVQSGSVNDYAGYLVTGPVVTVAVLTLV